MTAPMLAGCTVCGVRDHRPTILVDFPRQVHVVCMDWSARPFWFARHLKALREVWRREPTARPLVRDMGVELATLERTWAPSGEVILDTHNRLRNLVGQLRRAGVGTAPLRGL